MADAIIRVSHLEKSFGKMDKERFYQITGSQFMEINRSFVPITVRRLRTLLPHFSCWYFHSAL